MIVTILVGLFCLLVNIIYYQKQNALTGLLFSFLIVWIFLSIRTDFGTDFKAYSNMFNEISKLEIGDLLNSNNLQIARVESGWLILNYCFSFFHFNVMLSFIAFLMVFVYYDLIKNNVSSNYYWLSFFIFYFNINIMLISASAMRQSLAILCFIYSIRYLLNNSYIKYLLMITLAASFHTSALILYPLAFFCFHKRTLNKHTKYLCFIIFCSLYFLQPIYNLIVSYFIDLVFGIRYTPYFDLFTTEKSGLINMIIYILLMYLFLHYINVQSKINQILFLLTIIGLFFFPLNGIAPMASRVGYYFTPISMVTYPLLITSMIRKNNRHIFIWGLITVLILRLYNFYSSESYLGMFDIYHTIFE